MKKNNFIFYILLFIVLKVHAQSPGGVSLEKELWLKADEIQSVLPNDSTNVSLWQDFSGKLRDHIPNGTNAVPVFNRSSNLMNYQPSLNFGSAANTKLVGPDISVQADRSYYVFYVSRLNTGITAAASVYSMNAARNNTNGWSGGNPFFNTGGNTASFTHIHTSNGKNYSINTVIRPNQSTTDALGQMSYLNAVPQAFVARSMTLGTGVSIVGNSTVTTGYPFQGDIQEIIVFSGPQNTYMSDTDLAKVHSYLAVKYGISLDSSAQPDYINSNGDKFWTGANNTGYQNHIFGIGRDDLGSLYQKQSTSYDKPTLTVFVGDLADLNVNNQGTLSPNTHLMFGSNDAENTTAYEYNAGQMFLNGSLKDAVNYRQSRILKAQTFGQSSFTVNMRAHIGAQYILVSSEETFSPSTTRIYEIGANNIAKDVVVNNGDYVSFAFYEGAPAGIKANLELWLKADQIRAFDGEKIVSWQDLSGNARDHSQNGTNNVPVFNRSSGLMNYQPSLSFYDNADTKLVGPENFLVSTKSYYVFYVSEVDTESTGTARSTVYAFNAGRNNNNGWVNGLPNFNTASTTNRTHQGNGKTYGINVVMRPNQTGTAQLSYLNGVVSSTAFAAATMGVATGASVVGNSDLGSTYPFYGEVQEIIVFSGTQNAYMDATELAKIQSYLAVKYGISLDTAAQPDYINSNGDQIWTGTSNTGYQNHIFGIGRDDKGGLYQKQSTSYDKRTLTVFVGDLEELNVDNTGTLDDNTFLLFGSNDGQDFTSYPYEVGQAFANGTLDERVNFRQNRILKAQTFGKSSFTVNIKTHIGAKYVLISNSTAFDPAATRIYKVGDENIVRNAVVNNGDFVSFATYETAPGGVINGLRMWLKADETSTIKLDASGNVDTWKDFSSNGVEYKYMKASTANTAPGYDVCNPQMNYHPAVNFRKQGEYLSTQNGPMSVPSPDHYTYFTALNNNFGANARSYFLSFGALAAGTSARRPAIGVMQSGTAGIGRFYETGGALGVDGTLSLFNPGATSIAYHEVQKTPTKKIRYEFDGTGQDITAPAALGNGSRMNGVGTLGTGSSADRNMIGVMGEMFAYERGLEQKEKDAIYSYLGIKYGITLDLDKSSTATNFDYFLSDGTVIWPGTTSANHQSYHNNIAALVRDDDASLINMQARSTDVGAIVHMGMGKSLGCTGDLKGFENDKSAIVWGNDKASGKHIYDPNANVVCGDLESRMNRIWMVDMTGVDKQEVIIRAGNSNEFEYNTQYQVFLLVADSPEDLNNDVWNQAIPGVWVDGEVQFNYTFSEKTTYFTFGGVVVPGQCETCEFTGTKTIDFSKLWPRAARGTLSQTADLGDGFTTTVTVSDPNSKLRSGYPRFSGKTLQLMRRGNSANDTAPITTTMTFSKAAGASFEIYEIDRESRRLDDIEVYGLCGGGLVKPELTYIRAANRSSYTITDNKALARTGSYSTSSYTNTRGRMRVNFDMPVEQIIIVHKVVYNNTATGNQRIGIGPVTLFCPQPLIINEDGLALTAQAPQSLLLCEEVPYTFKITNTNCMAKTVTLDDVLPAGLTWVKESLSITVDGVEVAGTANEYAGTTTLNIQNIEVPGASDVKVRINAKFDENAAAGDYSTQASITYQNLTNVTVNFGSNDWLTGGPTVVTALASDRPAPVTIDKVSTSSSCISDNGEITVTMNITNPNAVLDYVTLDISPTEGFEYVANSLSASFSLGSASIIAEEGTLTVEDFNLPTGASTISFKVKAPAVLPTDIDKLEISIDLTSGSEMECVSIEIPDEVSDFALPFCSFCTQDPNTDPSTEPSQVGISTLKATRDGWPGSTPNGFIVMESRDKGFVITRTTAASIPSSDLVEGMLIYDTDDNCIKLYNGTSWSCIERSCNE